MSIRRVLFVDRSCFISKYQIFFMVSPWQGGRGSRALQGTIKRHLAMRKEEFDPLNRKCKFLKKTNRTYRASFPVYGGDIDASLFRRSNIYTQYFLTSYDILCITIIYLITNHR